MTRTFALSLANEATRMWYCPTQLRVILLRAISHRHGFAVLLPPSAMGEDLQVGALVEGEAPGVAFVEPEGAAAGVVLGAVFVGAGEGVGGQGDGVGEATGLEVGDGARGMGLIGEEEGDDAGAGVEAAAGAELGEGLVEEGFEGGAGGADAGGEVGVFEGEEGLYEARHGEIYASRKWSA